MAALNSDALATAILNALGVPIKGAGEVILEMIPGQPAKLTIRYFVRPDLTNLDWSSALNNVNIRVVVNEVDAIPLPEQTEEQ